MSFASRLRRCLIFTHRYLGIGIGLLVVDWFASGILMIYSGGMPEISAQQRLDHLASIDLAKVRLSAAEAAGRAGFGSEWAGYGDGRVTLASIVNRPAYHFGDEATVFADNGEVLRELTTEQSREIAADYLRLPPGQLQFAGELDDVDQWTIELRGRMPLEKFRAQDAARSEIYVQRSNGEIAMLTTRGSRTLAWFSAIPHWIYFTSLRKHNAVWYQVIVWTAAVACALAALGLTLAVLQFRRTQPFRLSAAIPYKGWMRWHYLTGAIFGVFALTWSFSGLLSMDPFDWTRAEGLRLPPDAFMGGLLDLDHFPNWEQQGRPFPRVCREAIKEIELTRVFGEPYYLVRCGAANPGAEAVQKPERHLVSAKGLEEKTEPFHVNTLVARIADLAPGVPILEQQILTEYDSYYRSRERQAPLPVLRVKLGDPAQTWFYVDLQTGRIAGQNHRLSRVKRWLYTGLHDMDFSFWYDRRPLWDIGVILLLLGGLASSSIGLCLGVKRLAGR